ncbi:MAG: NAD(P)H-dependent oxidoreductase subunit E, partial [Beijerinckiaceae bacterium]
MTGHSPFGNAEAEMVRTIVKGAVDEARAFFGVDAEGAAPLLPLLHALQAEFGYVDAAAIPLIADALNISQADVRGTISFYHDFRHAPPGKHVLKLCRAEACQASGGERIAAYLAARHSLKPGTTTADGSLTLENVYCLGNCALGPAALMDDTLVGGIDEDRAD